MRLAGASGSVHPPAGWIETTICVSGYPPVNAWSVESATMRLAVTGTFTVIREPRFSPIEECVRYLCGSCGRRGGEKLFSDERLGFRSYCASCVEKHAVRCGERHGRLPSKGVEFYCVSCEDIRALADLMRPDADGRRRYRCRPCRQRQWRMRAK